MHCIDFLTFSAKTDRKTIQAVCDEWGNEHCDPYERGGCYGGLGSKIRFLDGRLYDSYEEAVEYLETTTGNYRQCAVKYYEYPKIVPTKKLLSLQERRTEYQNRLRSLNEPHYKGVKQATVKCKHCGSSLSTAYCGKTYNNYCPICRTDIRPQSLLDRIDNCNKKLKEVNSLIKAEERSINEKKKNKATINWCVCCEVHC